jgi:hypothetical protein
MEKINITQSQLNQHYEKCNNLHKKGLLNTLQEQVITKNEIPLRFVFDRNLGLKGYWVVTTPLNVDYENDN